MKIRFAVGAPDGPRSAVWTAWRHTNRRLSDVFLAPRSLAGTLKISFHESGQIRDAFTAEYFVQHAGLAAALPTRARVVWERQSYSEAGAVRIYQVCIPHSELRSWPLEAGLAPTDISWIPVSAAYQCTCIEIVITRPGLENLELKQFQAATHGPLAHWYLPSGENFLVLPRFANLEPSVVSGIRAAVARILPVPTGGQTPAEALRLNLVMAPNAGVGATFETAWPCTV